MIKQLAIWGLFGIRYYIDGKKITLVSFIMLGFYGLSGPLVLNKYIGKRIITINEWIEQKLKMVLIY